MAANPTSGWDQCPLYGMWRKPFTEAPQTGSIELTIDRRVTRVDGAVIYTSGRVTIPLGTDTGSVATTVPASDDPDLTPESRGFQVHVREIFNDGTGKSYDVQPLLAHLDLTPPGINLGLVYVDPGTPNVPAPILVKGVAGGVATLDNTGHVPTSQLPTGAGGTTVTAVRNSDGTYDLTIG